MSSELISRTLDNADPSGMPWSGMQKKKYRTWLGSAATRDKSGTNPKSQPGGF